MDDVNVTRKLELQKVQFFFLSSSSRVLPQVLEGAHYARLPAHAFSHGETQLFLSLTQRARGGEEERGGRERGEERRGKKEVKVRLSSGSQRKRKESPPPEDGALLSSDGALQNHAADACGVCWNFCTAKNAPVRDVARWRLTCILWLDAVRQVFSR